MKPLYSLLPEEERGAARKYLQVAFGSLAILFISTYFAYVVLDQRRTIAQQRTDIENLQRLVTDLRGELNTYRFSNLDANGVATE